MTNEHKNDQPKQSQQAQSDKTQPGTGNKPDPKDGKGQKQPLKEINE